jgi:hypothetical protein
VLAHAFLAAMTVAAVERGGDTNDTAGLAPLAMAGSGVCRQLTALGPRTFTLVH